MLSRGWRPLREHHARASIPRMRRIVRRIALQTQVSELAPLVRNSGLSPLRGDGIEFPRALRKLYRSSLSKADTVGGDR